MPGTVLVVEDNPITRKVVDLALRSAGYQVVLVDNARDALAEVDRCMPDLVLQDVALGGDIDGFELISLLRRRTPTALPIFAFTGNANEAQLRLAGFDEVLVKPVEPTRLIQAVSSQLGHEVVPLDPAESPGQRAWRALTALLTQLTELTGSAVTADEIMSQVMTSFLDTAGISAGIAYTVNSSGALVPCAELGVSPLLARQLAAAWASHPVLNKTATTPVLLHRDEVADPALFDRAQIATVLLVPLADGDCRVGLLALGSVNPHLAREWLDLATAIVPPVTQAIRLAATIARVAASEHKFRGIAEATANGIVVTNAHGEITYVNSQLEALVGAPAAGLLGRRVTRVFKHLSTGAQTGQIFRKGEHVPVETTTRSFEDPPGEMSWLYVVRNLSERSQLTELSERANRDPLTGLFNRRRFEEELAPRLAATRRYKTPGAVLVIDLDGFKPVNDRYGHAAGDAVLRAVARILERHTRTSDLVARLGGDEFGILLDQTALAGAEECAQKLVELLSAIAVPYEDAQLTIGASIGVAEFPDHDVAPADLLVAADGALYRAKRAGRGRVCTNQASTQ